MNIVQQNHRPLTYKEFAVAAVVVVLMTTLIATAPVLVSGTLSSVSRLLF